LHITKNTCPFWAGLTSTQRAPAAEDNVGEETLPQIEVDAIDGVNYYLMHTCVFLPDNFRVEKDFWCTESFGTQLQSISAFSYDKIAWHAYLHNIAVR
jgi:hypothetical protein